MRLRSLALEIRMSAHGAFALAELNRRLDIWRDPKLPAGTPSSGGPP
jgi:hypothetical protein